MKKFITYVSMQKEKDLRKYYYEPIDTDRIVTKREVFFPISLLVDNYTKENEEIEMLCIKEVNNPDIERNFGVLKNEIENILNERNAKCIFTEITVQNEEKIDIHLHTFEGLIDHIKNKDVVYACITFGTKPVPIVEMMALDYAYKVKEDVKIDCVVYGKIDRRNTEDFKAYIYDVSALFLALQVVDNLAEMKVNDPERIIKDMIGIGRKA